MRTILIDMPLKCRGYIYEDVVTGEKCCVLNARLTRESNKKTYKHELNHVVNDDLHNHDDVDDIEVRSH